MPHSVLLLCRENHIPYRSCMLPYPQNVLTNIEQKRVLRLTGRRNLELNKTN